MSYILEALQKSEHARQRGKVPDLSTIPATTTGTRPDRSTRNQPYALAGFALTLLAAVLGWWRPWQAATHPQSPQLEQIASARQQPRQEAGEDQKITTAVPPAQEPTPAQARPAEEIQERPTAPPPSARAAANRPPATSASTPPPTAGTPPAQRIEKTPTKAGTPAPTASRPAPVATALLATRSPAEAAGSPQPSPAPARPASGRVLNVQELPPAVRNSLPRLTISGYASAGDSGKRMVVVNDRLVQEGEEAAPGVTVVTVGGDGAVFDYQGYRFRPQ